MCWKCDRPDAGVDDYLDELRRTMSEHGWAVQYVDVGRTPFAYTVLLHDCGLPELLITGVSAQHATRLLNTVAGNTMAGRTLTPGQKIAVQSGPLVEVVEVTNPDAHLNWAVAFGGPKVRRCSWCGPTAADGGRGRGVQRQQGPTTRARRPRSERIAVIGRHVAQLLRRRHHPGHRPERQGHLGESG
jgi:Domain of unknown function (DUF4262)